MADIYIRYDLGGTLVKRQQEEMENVIEQVKIFLPKLVEACAYVAELILEPLTKQGWEQFGDVVEGIDDLYKTLKILNDDMSQTNTFNALKSCIVRAVLPLSEMFQSMNLFMDQEDYRGASDSIRFELLPLLYQLDLELGEEKDIIEQRFKANIELLKRRFPKMYIQIESLTRDRSRYQITYAKNGSPNLYMINHDNKELYLYSNYDPAYETKRWAEKTSIKDENELHVFIYGFGYGYHAQSYGELHPDHRLYIYEPDVQVLLAAMEAVDLSVIFEQLNIADFVIGTNKEQRDRMFYRFLKYMKGEPELIALPVYDKIMSLDIQQFARDAEIAILHYKSSISTNEKFGMEWVTNSMYNLAHTLSSPSILGLKDQLSGMTAVVVGAGPSLEADIDYLRRIKKHAFIIAAGSTIQSLLYYGIKPHLIVSIDGGEANYNVFNNLDSTTIPLLYAPMINYRIIDKKSDSLFHVYLNNDFSIKHFMSLLSEDPIFQSTLSVTGTAIQAAIYMGIKEIVFTGQDLSYPNENMYAPGAQHIPKDQINSIIGSLELSVTNVHGIENRTNEAMMLTLADIEDLLSIHPDVRFINTTQMGAKINHTVTEPMEGVLDRLQDICLEEDFFIKKITNLQKYTEVRINKVYKYISILPEEMDIFEKRLKKINLQIETLLELCRIKKEKCLKTFAAIDAEWKEIVHSNPFKGLYLKVCRNDLFEFERDLPKLANESNLIKKAELARDIMQPLVKKMIRLAPELKEIVNETKRRVEVSIMGRETGGI